ncbi:hypothetical protein NLJ89_g10999 [Agrocybe chaxingu]|uniref:Uncharacterized protein n=1 Tax=Agrocybe chaxingu TaxID=84603 RepID=A0A9W8JT73_9AGAR|nr:hypothetical protein NLJ89_g10999 [Agrocybe chaxingu]
MSASSAQALGYDESWGTNEAIKCWRSDKVWKGDLLVLRGGKRANYVDIVRAKDREAAEQAVNTFLTAAGQITTKKTARERAR